MKLDWGRGLERGEGLGLKRADTMNHTADEAVGIEWNWLDSNDNRERLTGEKRENEEREKIEKRGEW